jgi:Leucine-rich repeat (LRR) protein
MTLILIEVCQLWLPGGNMPFCQLFCFRSNSNEVSEPDQVSRRSNTQRASGSNDRNNRNALIHELKDWTHAAQSQPQHSIRQCITDQVQFIIHRPSRNRRQLDSLVLSGADLRGMPDLFTHPAVRAQLTELRISDCQFPFNQVPPSMLDLPNLTTLRIDNSGIQSLPEFGGMPRLQELSLNFNQLTRIPDSIGNLSSLQRVYLFSNALESLPPLLNNEHLRQLSIVGINNNPITQQLNTSASRSQFSRIREPNTEHLPQRSTIGINSNPITSELNTSASRSQFSQIRVPATQSLMKNVEEWSSIDSQSIQNSWSKIAEDENVNHFNAWLQRLSATIDAKGSHLRGRITDLLTEMTLLLSEDRVDEARNYLAITQEANSSCNDRIAMTLNQLEQLKIVHSAERDKYSLSELKALGREMFANDLVMDICVQRAAATKDEGNIEDIEAYLDLQGRVKSKLNLQLGHTKMDYQAHSPFSREEVKDAVKSIKQTLDDKESVHMFLAKWEPMRCYINNRNPNDIQAITADFEKRADNCYSDSGEMDFNTLNTLHTQRDQAFYQYYLEKIQQMDDPKKSDTSDHKGKSVMPEYA